MITATVIFHFVHFPGNAPVLFDMLDDPRELNNLASNPDYSDILTELMNEIQTKWNIENLTQQIIVSQKQRLFILEALSKGKPNTWDFQPFKNGSKRFIRTSEKWADIEKRYYLSAIEKS